MTTIKRKPSKIEKSPLIDYHKKMISSKQIDIFPGSPIPKIFRVRNRKPVK